MARRQAEAREAYTGLQWWRRVWEEGGCPGAEAARSVVTGLAEVRCPWEEGL